VNPKLEFSINRTKVFLLLHVPWAKDNHCKVSTILEKLKIREGPVFFIAVWMLLGTRKKKLFDLMRTN
jgi:hypothetical protein